MLCNPGKPIKIYDIADIIGRSYPKTFTIENIVKGFKVTGIYPYCSDIFREDEFLSAYVTDRSAPNFSDHNETHDSFPIPVCNSPTIENNLNGPSISSFEAIRPFSKAEPRKQNVRGGRKKGKTRILTDTPEKLEISAGRKILKTSKKKPTAVEKGKKVININKKIDLTSKPRKLRQRPTKLNSHPIVHGGISSSSDDELSVDELINIINN